MPPQQGRTNLTRNEEPEGPPRKALGHPEGAADQVPEGLLDKLDDAQLRDLMAYLRSSQPLNDGT